MSTFQDRSFNMILTSLEVCSDALSYSKTTFPRLFAHSGRLAKLRFQNYVKNMYLKQGFLPVYLINKIKNILCNII